jgi:glyoxylase-like metal-dependent hydrolase (beta-lactamase superfamily II)
MGMRLIGQVFLVGGQDFNMVYLDWPANDCNTYLLDTGETLVLFDCGCGESLPGILENLREMDFDPRDVSHAFLTHAHMPHAGAAADLERNDVEIVGGPAAAEALKAGGTATVAYQYHRRLKPVGEVTAMADGEELTIGKCTIRAVSAPGHSADSMVFEAGMDGRRLSFCGDVVRSPLLDQHRERIDYDPEAYLATLEAMLADPPDVLYPGHGPFCLSKPEHWIGEEMTKLLRAR